MMHKNDKRISFMAVLALCLFFSPVVEAAKWDFMVEIIKQDKRYLAGIAKVARKSGVSKKIPDAVTLSQKMNIPASSLGSPVVRSIAMAGEEMMSHGAFAEKILNKSKVPDLVIKQYSRHGKEYLNVAESVGKIMTKSRSTTAASLATLKGKYKGMNQVINKFHGGKYDDDIFVRTIRKTGKRGIEVLGWMAKNKTLTLAGGGMVWYLYDPEGFETALRESGQSLGDFLSTVSVNIAGGVGSGLTDGLRRALNSNGLSSLLFGGLTISLLLLLWLSKTFRRIISFPLIFLGKKANAKMEDVEQNISHDQVLLTAQNKSMPKKKIYQPRSNL